MAATHLTVDHLPRQYIAYLFERIEINKAVVFRGTPCWIWTGATTAGRRGKRQACEYGCASRHGITHYAHRLIYAWLVASLPRRCVSDLSLDHLCRRTLCVNPCHLELIPLTENTLRGVGLSAQNFKKQYCKAGHELFGPNLRVQKKRNGRHERLCRTCVNAYKRERRRVRALAGLPRQ